MKSRSRSASRHLAVVLLALGLPCQSLHAQQRDSGFEPLRRDGNGIAAFTRVVDLDVRDARLSDVLASIQRQAGLDLVFGLHVLEGMERRITLRDSTRTAAQLLVDLLAATRLHIVVSPAGQAVVTERTAMQRRRATLTGTVREADGTAIADADVRLVDVHRRVLTDREGHFALQGIEIGPHVVIVRRLGYADVSRSIDLTEGSGIDIVMAPVPTSLSGIIVSPGVFGALEESVAARRSLTRDEIETAPQIGEDVFRSISRLPGVVGRDLSAAFGVRGSSNGEVLLRLDGIELIEPFHLKDVDAALSIVDLDAIGGVELSTGGFGAQYGDRLAGVLDMRTLQVAAGRPRTTLGISLTNLRAASAGSFAADRGSWLFTARRGYLDLALQLGGSDDPISPAYFDILAKLEYAFSDRIRMSAHVLHAGDDLHYTSTDDNPDLDSEYGSSYAWLNIDTKATDRSQGRTVLSLGRLTWKRSGNRLRDSFNGGLSVEDHRDYDFASIRQDWMYDATDRVLLRAGAEAQMRTAQYAYDATVEKYVIANGARFTATDTSSARATPDGTWTAVWFATRFRPLSPLTFELGVRWDGHTHSGDSDISPRLNAAWQVDDRTTIRGAWGVYAQAQGLHELQAQDGETEFARSERSEHRVIGIERSFQNSMDVRLEAYDQQLRDMRPRWVNLDNDGDFLPEATGPRARIAPTSAYSRGIEVMARKRAIRGLDWSFSWSIADTRQSIDGQLVPRERDQRHSIAADGAWTADGGWRFGAAWQYHTGWPMTPATMSLDTVDGAFYARRTWGRYNTTRLPAYHRLDVRISREFRTRRGRLLLSFDVYNLYGRKNARAVIPYVANIRNGSIVVGESISELLPRLPSFGVQWTF